MRYGVNQVHYEEVTIFDQPALFTECRIDQATVPEGVYRYELRHGDEDWGGTEGVGPRSHGQLLWHRSHPRAVPASH